MSEKFIGRDAELQTDRKNVVIPWLFVSQEPLTDCRLIDPDQGGKLCLTQVVFCHQLSDHIDICRFFLPFLHKIII